MDECPPPLHSRQQEEDVGMGAEERQKNKKSTWLSAVAPKLSFPYVVNNLCVREAGAWGPSVGLPPQGHSEQARVFWRWSIPDPETEEGRKGPAPP